MRDKTRQNQSSPRIVPLSYTFARVGAVIKMRVEDVYVQGRRTWVRHHEKGGNATRCPSITT